MAADVKCDVKKLLTQTAQTAFLPCMTENIMKHKAGTSQNDGMNQTKQTVAHLVGSLRAEVQQAVSIIKNDIVASNAGRMSPMQLKMMNVAENLQAAEKDTLVQLKQLLKSTNWELGERLDAQMSVNAQLGDQVQGSWEKILAAVGRLEATTSSLEGRIKGSETNVLASCTTVTKALAGIFDSLDSESRAVRSQANDQFDDLRMMLANQEERARKERQDVNNNLTQRVDQLEKRSSKKVEDVVHLAQDGLQGSVDILAQDLKHFQRQDERHYSELLQTMDAQMSSHEQNLQKLQVDTAASFNPVRDDLEKVKRLVCDESISLHSEMGRIQKALHVDYVKVERPTDMQQKRRCRDYFTQTESAALKETTSQTDPVVIDSDHKQKKPKKKENDNRRVSLDEKEEKMKKADFSGADKLKAQATAHAMQKPYSVFEFYHETGLMQCIAKHNLFENITLCIIVVNAFYISIDTDMNNGQTILDSQLFFQLSEVFFFLYFHTELFIRFMAFKSKRNCCLDGWFVFDAFLVCIMFFETAMLPLVLVLTGSEGGLPGGTSALKIIRLLRLLRLTRLTKLLRALPELLIIMKGVMFAARSVTIFLLLWLLLAYVFAILLRNLTKDNLDQPAIANYFPSVLDAMNNILLHGVFGENHTIIRSVSADIPWLWPIMIIFFALVSLTIMYMLVGVLVDVISVVAHTEKEKISVTYIVEILREELEKHGLGDDLNLSQPELEALMMEPGMIRVLQEAGVDVNVLADMLSVVFEDMSSKCQSDGKHVMNFQDLVHMLLGMRGGNPMTVKDCKEQIRVIKGIIKQCMEEFSEEMTDKLAKIRFDDDEDDT